MNSSTDKVHSLWITLEGARLVVPNATVVEVIAWRPLDVMDAGPDWLLGALRWRDQDLPVVSLERLLGLDLPDNLKGKGKHLLVFRSVKAHSSAPFFAALTSGIPRLFDASAVVLGDSLRDKPMPNTAADRISLNGEEAYIPHLEELQELIEDAWTSCRNQAPKSPHSV